MAKRVSVDKWLFTVTLLLVFIGLVMVFSASAVMAKERFGSPYGFLVRQMAWAAAGLLAMIVIMNVDYKKFRRPPVVFTFLGITSLLLIAVFLFRDSHNTHRLDQVWRLVIPALGSLPNRRLFCISRISWNCVGNKSPIGRTCCSPPPRRPSFSHCLS